MSWYEEMAGAAGALDFGSSLGFGIYDRHIDKQRYKDYRKDIQTTRMREDTATQRKMADLQGAGLNPLLAVGAAGAASSQPSHAPGEGRGSPIDVMNLIAAKEQISMSRTQRELIKAEIRKMNADTEMSQEQVNYFRGVSTARTEIELRENRMQQALEKTNIEYRIEELRNLKAETRGQELANIIHEQEREMNDIRKQLLEANVTEAQQRAIAQRVNAEIAQATKGFNIQAAERAIITADAQIAAMRLAYKINNHDYELSDLAEKRTTDKINGNVIFDNAREMILFIKGIIGK